MGSGRERRATGLLRRIPLVVALVTFAAAPCFSAEPDDAAKCRAAKGSWGRHGLSRTESCVVPTSDAGKSCHDESECESGCIAPEGAKIGDRATGTCYELSLAFGCRNHVRKGVVQPTLCVD